MSQSQKTTSSALTQSRISILLFPLVISFSLLLLTGCGGGPPTTPVLENVAEPTSTYTPAPEPTPTDNPTPQPPAVEQASASTPEDIPARGQLPNLEQLEQIKTNLILNNEENLPVGAHPAPPPKRLEILTASLQQLFEEGFNGVPLRNESENCCDIFERQRATTYSLPEAGALFQIISISEEAGRLDSPLSENGQWGDSALVVGGLLVYQTTILNDNEIPPGNYLVLLQGEETDFAVLLLDEALSPVFDSRWRLRFLRKAAAQAFSVVTQNELCYSQQQYQACINWQVNDFTGNNGAIANNSLQRLIDNGWLLPDTGFIPQEKVVASIESSERTLSCANQLAETPEGLYERCQPDVVAYATEHKTDLKPEQEGIKAWYVGIGGLEILQPLEKMVLDSNGERVSLEPNSYRVDLLEVDDQSWLFQFVPADASDDGPFFYTEGVPITGIGFLVNGAEEVSGNDVILDPVWYRPCLDQTAVTAQACATDRFRRPVCINWQDLVGWCDVIEPESQ